MGEWKMHLRSVMTAAVIALGTATPAVAQGIGVEAGGFALTSWYDDNHRFDDGGPGLGGHLGLFFLPRLSIEGEASWNSREYLVPEGGVVGVVPLRARLLYNHPVGAHTALLLGAGYTAYSFQKDLDDSESGVGVYGGVRLGVGGPFHIRLGVTGDFIGDAFNADVTGEESAMHWGFQAGLSTILGRRGAPRAQEPAVQEAPVQEPAPVQEAPPVQAAPPADADGDGVPDTADRCANTPAGTRVDAAGCPVPQDADRDGVTDDADRCPGTPAGTLVDSSGCPVPQDADGDGVVNENDRCPDTSAGARVDASGCAIVFEAEQTTLVLEGVNFAVNRAVLTDSSHAILDRVAASLRDLPDVRVEVGGHTDSTGGRALNQRLSQARAEAVRDYLISKGVAADRLEARGYGPDEPVATNRTAEGRAQNRRVELKRID